MIYGVIDLMALQKETQTWREANFDAEKRDPVRQALGVCEESGELAHAVLKLDQGIRGSRTEHIAAMQDAMGDLVIYMMGLCEHYDLDLAQCIKDAWTEVKERDWRKNPDDGR